MRPPLLHASLLALPAFAPPLLISPLVEAYQLSAGQPESTTLPLLFSLLLAKRLALYAIATSALGLAAWRSTDASSPLGRRLDDATREALWPIALPPRDPSSPRANALTALDGVSPAQQAAGLPLAAAALLLASVVAGGAAGGGVPPPAALPLAAAWSGGVCCLLVNGELQQIARRGGPPARTAASYAALAAALAATAAAYALHGEAAVPWRNLVNICVAVGVSRVIQLRSFAAAAAAAAGLALYDGLATAAAAPAAALDAPPPGALADGSLMERVASARVAADFQPGLLVVAVGGRVTDALGLGDVVFPSLLAGWARRLDASAHAADGYFGAALRGYVAGCVLLEVTPVELTKAALLFFMPSMLASILLHATSRGELEYLIGDGDARPPS
ncbi:hypothetical protein AB1Y20_003031 [Prymnesium parvum]|uniref:Dolichol kinase n=1 Tax=Prymnesium parvum TaxID=97485 RepID=A0AB34JD43_PRYPA